MKSHSSYFLPYQQAWLDDESDFKIWEKTRRGGMTYVQSYEDVRDAVAGKWDVWFSSADETAAREYIRYCEQWAKLFKEAARAFNESIFSEQGKAITVFTITFKSGKRITAMTSNPNKFRSKGGKVVLDEFAHHEDQDAMWAAAEPTTTWGFPLRIISTHNGKNCKFYKLIQDIRAGKIKGSVHRTDIHEAVEQGLVTKILQSSGKLPAGVSASASETEAWLEEKRSRVGARVWKQEYLAEAEDEAGSFMSYEFIERCMRSDILKEDLNALQNPFVIGMDIGRRRDLTVIWLAEIVERRRYTRHIITLERTPFRTQYLELARLLKHPRFGRACIDATGIGNQLAEDATREFGAYRIEAVTFTLATKGSMADGLYNAMEDAEFLIPADGKLGDVIREDFHSVRTEQSDKGNRRFVSEENSERGESHADYFWAAALCNRAARGNTVGNASAYTEEDFDYAFNLFET
jgi:phage FluMu gp28-like protein